MTKTEKRLKVFKTGIKQLNLESRNYIHKLTHILFLVEEPPVCPAAERKMGKRKK